MFVLFYFIYSFRKERPVQIDNKIFFIIFMLEEQSKKASICMIFKNKYNYCMPCMSTSSATFCWTDIRKSYISLLIYLLNLIDFMYFHVQCCINYM